ncbi:MAG: hypothetical protein WAS07_00725 [Micropruina sp.]
MTRNESRRAERTSFPFPWVIVAATAALAAGSLLFSDLSFRVGGVAVAVAGGVVACLLAMRDTAKARARAEAEAAGYLRWSVAKLHEERTRHGRVLSVVDDRNKALRVQVTGLVSQTAQLQREVSTLRGNYEALRIDISMAATLQAAAEAGVEAEVLAMPRRATGSVDRLAAADLWDHADSPTVVDLQRIAAPYVDEVVRNLA